MGGLLKFSRIIDEINAQFGVVANWLVLLACLISAANAAVRYGINGMLAVAADVPLLHGLASGIGWYGNNANAFLELQWYMFAGMVLLGGPYTLKMNEHVRVDLFYGMASDRAHEGEEGNSEQEIVRDDAEQLVSEVAEKVGLDKPEFDADKSEEQAGRRQRECRRIADQHEPDHPREHQGGHVVADEVHCSGFSYLNSASIRSSSAAMRFMISETPWSAIRPKPTGRISFTGQRSNPPALFDCSPSRYDSRNHGQVK